MDTLNSRSIASILVVNGDREFTRLDTRFSCRVNSGQSDLHNVPCDRPTAHVESTRPAGKWFGRTSSRRLDLDQYNA